MTKIEEILNDSNYQLSLFTQEEILELETRITARNSKGVNSYYSVCLVRGKEILMKPEEVVRQLYLKRLFTVYGCPKNQIKVEHPIQIGSSKTLADIAIFNAEKHVELMLVEVKKPKEQTGREQLRSYCNATGCPYGIWTNGNVEEYYELSPPNYFSRVSKVPTYKEHIETILAKRKQNMPTEIKPQQNSENKLKTAPINFAKITKYAIFIFFVGLVFLGYRSCSESNQGKYAKYLIEADSLFIANKFDESFNKYEDYLKEIDNDSIRKMVSKLKESTSKYQYNLGFATIKKGNKYGYLDRYGNELTQCIYDSAYPFNANYAQVIIKEKYGCINSKGKLIIPCSYDYLSEFSEGLAVFLTFDKSLYGYIDTTGKTVIPAQYAYAERFKKGIAFVTNENGRRAMINKKGEFITNFNYDSDVYSPDITSELKFVSKNGKSGIIDSKGVEITPFVYDDAYPHYLENVKLICLQKNKKYGLVKTNGQEITDFVYDESIHFSEFWGNIAKVKTNGKVGLLNKEGHYVLYPEYEYLSPYHDGNGKIALIVAKKNNKWGILDDYQLEQIPFIYDSISSAKYFVVAMKDKKWGFLDNKGKVLKGFVYDEAIDFDRQEGIAKGKIGVVWQCLDENLKEIKCK